MASTETDTSIPDGEARRSARARTGMHDELIPPGTIIDERYRIDDLLGEGGMGAVYTAEHVKVGRRVAFKVLSAQWCESDNVVRRFRDEARAASAAGHPNIVEVFDAGDLPDGRPYLVMEYLEGRELSEVIERHGGLELERACRIVRDVARALDAAHARGVIHRDLKGENVMLVERGGEEIVKVLDFGIAANNALVGPRTVPGLVMGTPATMAPEQVRGKPPTIAFDVYALGVLLHFAVSGHLPFDDRDGISILVAKTTGPAPSIITLCAGLPDLLVELVDSCLALEPALRPATAREVADRLGDVLEEIRSGRTVRRAMTEPAPPPANAMPAALDDEPPRWRVVVPVVLLMVLLSLGVSWLILREPPRDEASPRSDLRAEAAPAPTFTATSAEKAAPLPPVPTPVPTPSEPSSPDPTEPVEPVEREPSVGSLDSGKPEPSPGVEPDAPPAADSSLCWRTRKQAQQAREVHDWSGVIRHTRAQSCWSEQREQRRRLRAKAFMELGQWSACVEASRGLDDAEGRQWQQICRRRKEQG